MCMYIYILYNMWIIPERYISLPLCLYIYISQSFRSYFLFYFSQFQLKVFLSMVSTPAVGIPGDTYRHGGVADSGSSQGQPPKMYKQQWGHEGHYEGNPPFDSTIMLHKINSPGSVFPRQGNVYFEGVYSPPTFFMGWGLSLLKRSVMMETS